jgi:hypothetical protein
MSRVLEDIEEDVIVQPMSGGKVNNSLKVSFVDYMTTFTSNEKAQMLNLVQYGGLAVLPVLVLLKLMKMYVPPEDPFKGTPELAIEVAVQLTVILIALLLIHKLVVYVPTYSKVEYGQINLLTMVLPLVFLLTAMDTAISAKLNVLFDRLLMFIGIKQEPLENKENGKENGHPRSQTTTRTTSQYDMVNNNSYDQQQQQQQPLASRLIGGFPTQRDTGASSGPNVPSESFEMMSPMEPMAANEGIGATFF